MDKKQQSSAVAVLAIALLMGLALPSSASHDDPTGKTHEGPDGFTYVNLGLLGDHLIACLVNVEDQQICLGGASTSTTDTTPPSVPSYWEVWAQDTAYELTDDLTGGSVDLVPALFARMTATASRSTTTVDSSSCVPSAPATRGCQSTTTTEMQTKILAQFSVCGKAGVAGIDTDAFTDLIASKGTYDTYTLTKEVYVGGPLFSLLDCGIGGTTLKPVYGDFVHWYNNDPSNPPSGPFSLLPPNSSSTCNPGLPAGGTVCLFEFPAGASHCWNSKYAAGHTMALPGIIGTLAWSHENLANLDCHEPLGESPWMKTASASKGVQIQNFPVEVNNQGGAVQIVVHDPTNENNPPLFDETIPLP